MSQLGARISFRNYPKIVQEKSRRTLLEPTREFGKNITNLPTARDKKDISTDQSSSHNPRKTVLRIRSVSINGRNKVQQQKQVAFEYQKSILNTLIKRDKINTHSNSSNMFQMKLRTLTIDWIVDIHNRLKLKDETLFLFFQYFDQYCYLAQVPKGNFRTVGITCLWIAAKFEQVYCPRLSSFANLVDGVTDRDEMKIIQTDILQKLNYNLIRTTPLQLLNIILGVRRGTQQQSLSKYILQLSYAYNLNSKYKPSVMTIVALNFVEYIYRQKTQYRKYKQELGVGQQKLVECFKQVCMILQKSHSEVNITALKGKYDKIKNHEVGKLKLEIKQSSLINN